MNIGIDGRVCDSGGYYGDFICELIEAFKSAHPDNNIMVYRQKDVGSEKGGFMQNRKAKKVFTEGNHDLMIFFGLHIPSGYKGKYILILEDLKEIFFPKKRWLHRKLMSHTLKKSIERSALVGALDTGTAMELNENLNISEDKIFVLGGFFPRYNIPEKASFPIDIMTKHNLTGRYLIYDSGNEVHNNFERILKSIAKLKEKGEIVHLLVLCDDTTKDLDLRSKSIGYDLTSQVLFLGSPKSGEEAYYYEQSSGVIFSSIYESFPFQFTKALHYNCPIFANDILANMHVMKESIHYLDPLSIGKMSETILTHLRDPHETHYDEILSQDHIHSVVTSLGSATSKN